MLMVESWSIYQEDFHLTDPAGMLCLSYFIQFDGIG